jgi:hypothetical protein
MPGNHLIFVRTGMRQVLELLFLSYRWEGEVQEVTCTLSINAFWFP